MTMTNAYIFFFQQYIWAEATASAHYHCPFLFQFILAQTPPVSFLPPYPSPPLRSPPSAQSILPITTAQKAENLVFKASAQSSLPQTTAYPCRSVHPRQNALFSTITPLSQPSLTKAGVRPFCPVQPHSNHPSLPLPFQASISFPERPYTPFSHSCLAKIKQACTSLKIRYRAHLPSTLDLTKTCKPCFA